MELLVVPGVVLLYIAGMCLLVAVHDIITSSFNWLRVKFGRAMWRYNRSRYLSN